MQTVNELDYTYRKLVVKAQEKHNNTIDISDEEYDKYYNNQEYSSEDNERSSTILPGRFQHSDVNSNIILNAACNSIANWCIIQEINDKYIFTNSTGQQSIGIKNSVDNRNCLGLCGFIVGLPNIPEMGETDSHIKCYDLACPNCYNDNNIIRKLHFSDNGTCTCNECSRTYDLNNSGLCINDAAKSLYNYRCTYVNNSLFISDCIINNSLKGTWHGNMYISSEWDGRVYDATYSEICFLKDPYSYNGGKGYWCDYYNYNTNQFPSYILNHIDWVVNNNTINIYFVEEGVYMYIENYSIDNNYFIGTTYNGREYNNFRLVKTEDKNWDNMSFGWVLDGNNHNEYY